MTHAAADNRAPLASTSASRPPAARRARRDGESPAVRPSGSRDSMRTRAPGFDGGRAAFRSRVDAPRSPRAVEVGVVASILGSEGAGAAGSDAAGGSIGVGADGWLWTGGAGASDGADAAPALPGAGSGATAGGAGAASGCGAPRAGAGVVAATVREASATADTSEAKAGTRGRSRRAKIPNAARPSVLPRGARAAGHASARSVLASGAGRSKSSTFREIAGYLTRT